jgi:hypothetical protein
MGSDFAICCNTLEIIDCCLDNYRKSQLELISDITGEASIINEVIGVVLFACQLEASKFAVFFASHNVYGLLLKHCNSPMIVAGKLLTWIHISKGSQSNFPLAVHDPDLSSNIGVAAMGNVLARAIAIAKSIYVQLALLNLKHVMQTRSITHSQVISDAINKLTMIRCHHTSFRKYKNEVQS